MLRKGWGGLRSDFMSTADAKPQCLQETRSSRVGLVKPGNEEELGRGAHIRQREEGQELQEEMNYRHSVAPSIGILFIHGVLFACREQW